MSRKKSTIKVADKQSLESLMQETYFDACSLSKEAQNNINKLKRATNPETVDDYAKIAKEVTSALKVKESATKIKLDIVRVQNDIIKNGQTVEEVEKSINTTGKVDFRDFKHVRDIVNSQKEQ